LKSRKNKKDIIFIDYCRFVVRERNLLERESDRCVYEERKREKYVERKSERAICREREIARAIRYT
jgi:hypothetical protein